MFGKYQLTIKLGYISHTNTNLHAIKDTQTIFL